MTLPTGPSEYTNADPSMLKSFAAYLLSPTSILLVAVLLVEGSWLYLWMVLMGRWDGLRMGEIPLGPLPIVLIPWLSYHSSQLFGQQRWSQEKAQWVTGLAVVVLLLMVVRLENGGGHSLFDPGWIGFAAHNLVGSFPTSIHITLVGSVYLWWRGYKLAQGALDQEQVVNSFLVGLGGIIIGLLVWEMATVRPGVSCDPGAICIHHHNILLLRVVSPGYESPTARALRGGTGRAKKPARGRPLARGAASSRNRIAGPGLGHHRHILP